MWACNGRPLQAWFLRLVIQIGEIALQDCGNGTYMAVVKMDRAGLVSIHAQINGQPLGLPATLHVLPAELHSLLMVTPPAINTIAGALLSRTHLLTHLFVHLIRKGAFSLSCIRTDSARCVQCR